MTNEIHINGRDYAVDELSEDMQKLVGLINFVDTRLGEFKGTLAVYVRSKNSYIDSLKREVLYEKSGLIFNDE